MKTKNPLRDKAYYGTVVSIPQTQQDINNILVKYGITQYAHYELGDRLALDFVKVFPVEGGGGKPVSCRIVLPYMNDYNRGDPKKVEETKRQIYRALWWYLKTKLEAVDFGLTEFVQEFFSHIMIEDKSTGRRDTVYNLFGEGVALNAAGGPDLRKMLGDAREG